MDLTALRSAIDTVFDASPDEVGDPSVVIELERARNRLEGAVTRAVAAFDRSEAWRDEGAKTPSAWLMWRCRLPERDARRQVRLSRSLPSMDHVARSFAGGALSSAHVDALRSVVNPRTIEAFERDEAMLVGQAEELSYAGFCRSLRYWSLHADPDGQEDAAEARRTRRSVSLNQSFQGTWFGTINLDDISGSIVAGELERLEKILFESDWAEAKERLGRDPKVHELSRSASQRKADALVLMATRSAAMVKGSKVPRPLFTVLVGYETLHDQVVELANRAVLTPGSLVPYLDRAEVERAVFTKEGRVEVSEKDRFFTGATRRGLEIRDRGCAHPGCEEPVTRCEADHVVPFSEGGPTTQANGQMLCKYHNLWKVHRSGPTGKTAHGGGSGKAPPGGGSGGDDDDPDDPDDPDDADGAAGEAGRPAT